MAVTGRLPAAFRASACLLAEADAFLARRPVGWPLGAREDARFESLATEKRRREWLAGRVAAKRAVSEWLAEQGSRLAVYEIEVLNESSGRPFCRLPLGAVGPEISISHAGGLAVCALSDGGPIGVDCEPIAPKTAGTLALVASGEELARAGASPEAQTRLWCAKEAVLKLLGLGLSCDPRDVVLDGRAVALRGAARERWRALDQPAIFLSERTQARSLVVIAHTVRDGGRHG